MHPETGGSLASCEWQIHFSDKSRIKQGPPGSTIPSPILCVVFAFMVCGVVGACNNVIQQRLYTWNPIERRELAFYCCLCIHCFTCSIYFHICVHIYVHMQAHTHTHSERERRNFTCLSSDMLQVLWHTVCRVVIQVCALVTEYSEWEGHVQQLMQCEWCCRHVMCLLTSCTGSYETLLAGMTGGRGGRGGRGRRKGGKQQRRAEPFYYLGQGTCAKWGSMFTEIRT